MPGKYLRGAFVQMTPGFTLPIPNVILFQYNPESLTHTWQPAAPDMTPYPTASAKAHVNPLAVEGLPGESFSFNLAMDANDMIADGGSSVVAAAAAGLATATGIYSRLCALEMLLYPTGSFPSSGLVGTITAAATNAATGTTSGAAKKVPQFILPTVLFIWGPARILPVRVTGLTITETLYDALLLNPTHAEAQVSLQVLTPDEVLALQDALKQVAIAAYNYSQAFRQAQALANLANGADTILGMLPIG
ncbi:MAG TPA: hypothetical protein VK828_02955 [Terriglobales bacterium]|jgi:hypothetical protein|nr:hypothetical protein [Terriglobales bacterium]